MPVVVLLGFMGSGKTTLGKLLAQKIQVSFLDLDHFIEVKERDSILNIFKNKGEPYFRELETKYLQEIMDGNKSCVLALGGGAFCFSRNREILKDSLTVYIKVCEDVLVSRLRFDETRPLLHSAKQNLEEFVRLKLKDREEHYLKAKQVLNSSNDISKDVNNLTDLIKLG